MAVLRKIKVQPRLSHLNHQEPSAQMANINSQKMSDLSLWDGGQTAKPSEQETSKINPVSIMIAASALLVIGLTCYFLVDKFVVQAPTKIPLISAPKGPYKIRPEDPGGIVFPHQDKFIYGKLSQNKQHIRERILPESERPVNLPQKTLQRGATSNVSSIEVAPTAITTESSKLPASIEVPQAIQLSPPEPLPAPRRQIIAKTKPEQAIKPVKTSTSAFDNDLANLIAGNNQASHDDLVIPEKIPQNSPLHATAEAKVTNPKKADKTISTGKIRYRLQLATLPSLQAAKQERENLIELSQLSHAQFEIQGFTNNNGQIVYRIFYGKYKSDRKAQKARKLLLKKGLHPIVLKMG